MTPEQVEIVTRTMERIQPQIQIFAETLCIRFIEQNPNIEPMSKAIVKNRKNGWAVCR